MYKRALANPRSAIAYIKHYSSQYKSRNESIRRLVDTTDDEIQNILDEVSDLYREIKGQLDLYKDLKMGDTLNPLGAPILYVLARLIKPAILVETGVSSGVSSAFVLKALSKNNHGELFSIDLPNADPDGVRIPKDQQSGWIIPHNLRSRHHLILGDSRIELPKLLTKVEKVDWFFHDSLHTYEFMLWEYREAWPYLRSGGLLLSDDVTWNEAFPEFVKQVRATKWATFYSIGAIRKI